MVRDILLLIQPDFVDPQYPGRRFYCWHCALLEGVLASFPELRHHLDVERVAWPRPRARAVELVGEANQSLPLLVLSGEPSGRLTTETYRGRHFIANKDAILDALFVRYGIAEPHP